ncbi:hypothetical protein Sipo8835_09850 [Streptomyces ipomoeae]|uniref:Uncharacterized protein n=1 Tax=Streptomyces ipomoeae TaxID=103232 RepID=A0AAE9B1W0_9ACTN|nr:hypothetical protein [Streptomyces ipomoeae]TQE36453.1 hypothetical protein Sipo7851_12210 [Streptomyces ipomoeae]TQE36634.1 hypothetical protein Sipo8835_09850 [Streptomyces ipomoeae]
MHRTEEEWLATQRPSRIREVQAGRLAWTEVDLIDIQGGSARPLREGLEVFGVQVNYLRVGQPRHLVAALDGTRPIAPYVILSCHGDEGHILMDDVAEELAEFQPFNGAVGPDRVREHLRLPGSVTLATGCDTGDPALAEAFLDAGASMYIAPTGAPFGYASVFAPLFFFYELTERRTPSAAVERLRAHDTELAMWQLYQR